MQLTAASTINTAGGNITLSGTVDGDFTLDLTAGTGNITFSSAVGQTTPPAGLDIVSANNVLINSGMVHSGPFSIDSSTGTTTINGTLDATSITINGVAINFNNAVTSHGGSIAITNSGTFTIGSTAPVTSSTSFIQTGAGTVTLGADIDTTGTLSLASPITMTQAIALNSGGGNLTLSNTVGGDFDLTLTAGAGNLTLGGTVGLPFIGVLTIASANNISLQAINADSIVLSSATGTTTMNGAISTDGMNGIILTGNNFVWSNSITTTNAGPLTITNSGLLSAVATNSITLNGGGAFLQNGTGPVHLGCTITTQNANITFMGAVAVLSPRP